MMRLSSCLVLSCRATILFGYLSIPDRVEVAATHSVAKNAIAYEMPSQSWNNYEWIDRFLAMLTTTTGILSRLFLSLPRMVQDLLRTTAQIFTAEEWAGFWAGGCLHNCACREGAKEETNSRMQEGRSDECSCKTQVAS
ncbi:hypothetical protein BO71DRAFT_221038 [Aspergillus ellipticus CBS 707.79]|uniref:Secreted protein n=1 Tax=Aspergillus ellipticus CBS 707.79 TaxID=1448320 RepID=A0A319DBK0_9EURO|nr:hypothetical protein BO71DRAFT_221038 [Aspergillus ellipticus CBS 707.79]